MIATMLALAGCQALQDPPRAPDGCRGCFGRHSGIDTGVRTLLDPIAVGFAFDGVVRTDGSIVGYNLAGYGSFDPTVTLFFADERFFQGDASAVCLATGTFQPALRACDLPNDDAADTWNSYEGTLTLTGQNCAGLVDPAVWGPDAQDLWGPFDQLRLGLSFGEMTPYLEGAWDPATLATYSPSMSAMYVSINAPDGSFVGADWTTAISWAWDPGTGNVVVAGGYLQDIRASITGTELNQAYIRTYPYWYQDFPLMDFSVLGDQPPPTYDPCPLETGMTGDTGLEGPTGDTGSAPPVDTDPPEEPADTDDAPPDGDKEEDSGGGCGCASPGSPAGLPVALLGVLAMRRRR